MVQKLELIWFGKENIIEAEPRILLENSELSNLSNGPSENMLIHGDNLLTLKALEQDFSGKIKCIYIDPPYNTGSAFEHYDDDFEHSTWLSLMKSRLELLKKLLKDDGSIWISIDSYESHYLKVLCDEIFGRSNFINEVIWQRAYAPVNLKKTLSQSHDTILIYAKNLTQEFLLNKLPRSTEADKRYKNPDDDSRGPWKSADMSVGPAVESNIYPITTPSGRTVFPPSGRSWLYSEERFEELKADNRIWFGKTGNNVPSTKKFLSEVKDGVVAQTLWTYQEVGHTQDAKREVKKFNSESVFATPKPEKLIERILTLASNEGDLVLDSFLGSGTTAAVAQKMNRRWIGIEMGDHAYTHCKVRLDQVVDGTDQGGISKSQNWQGGGGYHFYELASSLITKDEFGVEVISDKYEPSMLAAAVAKLEGFDYDPSSTCFWKQSKSTENSYLFVTDRIIDVNFLKRIHDEMKEDEFLLISCGSFDSGCAELFSNIRLKKIPDSLLGKCEYGSNGYPLNIVNPPVCDDEDIDKDEE